jgi:hypothetical protein
VARSPGKRPRRGGGPRVPTGARRTPNGFRSVSCSDKRRDALMTVIPRRILARPSLALTLTLAVPAQRLAGVCAPLRNYDSAQRTPTAWRTGQVPRRAMEPKEEWWRRRREATKQVGAREAVGQSRVKRSENRPSQPSQVGYGCTAKAAWLRPFVVVCHGLSGRLDHAGGLEVPSSNLGAPMRRSPRKIGGFYFPGVLRCHAALVTRSVAHPALGSARIDTKFV